MKHPDDNQTIDMIEETTRRGRKPLAAAEPVTDVVDAIALASANSAVSTTAAMDDAVIGFSETLQQLGQIAGLEFTRRVADVAQAQIFQNIKKAKQYKGLPYKDASGNTRHVADLDELCDVFFGKSSRRMQELSANLTMLGPELYEQSERLGLRQRDYAAIKALPDDSRMAVAQAIESGDRGAVIDLVQELAARTEAEKKKRVDAEQTAEARARLLSEATEKNLRLQEKLRNPYVPNPDSVAQTQEQDAALKELQAAFALAHTNTMRVAAVCSDVFDRFDGTPLADHARACIDDIVRALAGLSSTHGIDVDLTLKEALTPAWLPR